MKINKISAKVMPERLGATQCAGGAGERDNGKNASGDTWRFKVENVLLEAEHCHKDSLTLRRLSSLRRKEMRPDDRNLRFVSYDSSKVPGRKRCCGNFKKKDSR